MLYELAHIIKSRCSFLWDFLEWGNSVAFFFRYRDGLRCLSETVNSGVPPPYEIRVANKDDVAELQTFFSLQPKESFAFFQPHGFDERAIRKIVRSKSFLTFILIEHRIDGDNIVGYAFMRSFVNGASYRGYMVDVNHRGKGLATIMGLGLNRVGDALNLKMYKSISPDNPASMRATEKVCNVKILKTLENGDYLMECTKKAVNETIRPVGGGRRYARYVVGNLAITPLSEIKYAA